MILGVKENADSICSNLLNCSSLSSTIGMSQRCIPNLVYRRRKLQKNSVTGSLQACADGRNSMQCQSAASSEDNRPVEKNNCKCFKAVNETEAVAAPLFPTLCNSDPITFYSKIVGERQTSKPSTDKSSGLISLNDSCSSSMSVIEHTLNSVKIEGDEIGECSSSGVLVGGFRGEDISERDLCISLLKNYGLLNCPGRISSDFTGSIDGRIYGSTSYSCKVCGSCDVVRNMLICDHCDEPYHMSCCNPRVRNIPVGEWLCHSCLKKKHKLLQVKSSREVVSVGNDVIHKSAVCRSESSRIAFMLADTDPYTTGVRIGKAFQAEVPEWSGPIINEHDSFGEPRELSPLNIINNCNPQQVSKLSCIGNWLQCQEVIKVAGDVLGGKVCGKWRRAPLFEVQTDKWDCFSSVFWDPCHADCAAPQELETDEVLKQLKYVELLRPRLAAKRRRLNCNRTRARAVGKGTGALDHST